jgi:hypothetical protein
MQPTASTAGCASAFVLLSPLQNWKGAEQAITGEIHIRRLVPPERAALDESDSLLRHHDIGESARDAHWLCYQFENPYPADNVRYRRRQDAAFKLMLHAMYSVQILAPIGAPNLFLLYRRTDDGLTLDATQHRQPLIETVWGRVCDIPASFQDEIPAVLERLHEAFQKPILRLQIPVWLLEQGMAAPDRHIRILLWTTGLDGIVRGGGTVAFAERLCDFLGADTQVLPPSAANRRPMYRVTDIVQDLYQLRNEMAHGLPFHEKFRKTRGFLADEDEPISEDFANYRYDQVLEECAVFLLCRALKDAFFRNSVL